MNKLYLVLPRHISIGQCKKDITLATYLCFSCMTPSIYSTVPLYHHPFYPKSWQQTSDRSPLSVGYLIFLLSIHPYKCSASYNGIQLYIRPWNAGVFQTHHRYFYFHRLHIIYLPMAFRVMLLALWKSSNNLNIKEVPWITCVWMTCTKPSKI